MNNVWLILGFTGQFLFGARFLLQWISSEKKKKSYIPDGFWYLSIAGGIILLVYSIHRKDPVFILGQSFGLVVYIRNIILIARHKKEQGSQLSL